VSSHHPSSELLEYFAEASLDGSLASVVSAHVEHCSSCQKLVRSTEQELSSNVFSGAVQISSTEASDAWKSISSRMNAPKSRGPSTQGEIFIDGIKFDLPRSLHKLAAKPMKWMPFGKGGKISKLGDERGKSFFLIYLSSNEEVPMHSHEGSEYSYVIAGSYSADGLTFETGDFSVSTETVTHAPKAGSEDGCLLLSSVENRLNFFQGWLRPFNALLWWVLNLRVKFVK
jgi:putative transcriptional regulator